MCPPSLVPVMLLSLLASMRMSVLLLKVGVYLCMFDDYCL